jgi:WD40 repeat protein
MGVVYEAEQVSLGRRVALKVLPIHAARDTKALERFRREARSAAKLHHTNIVPVFEVGQDGDAFYYAMQFIQGQSLDQVIGELRRLREHEQSTVAAGGGDVTQARPRVARTVPDPSAAPRLSQVALSLMTEGFRKPDLLQSRSHGHGATTMPAEPTRRHEEAQPATLPEPRVLAPASGTGPEPDPVPAVPRRHEPSEPGAPEPSQRHLSRSVAQIGQQAAHALAYAHARGLIHRDIKPSNLLLDAAGVIWVTDFGLAKLAVDDAEGGLTQTGEFVGTVRYMAPERFQGACDARADIYALGLTLYELLLLRPAFQATDRLSVIDQIQHHDPPPPRRLDRRLPRDLETILLKAMERDPNRRYPSAEEMAEDLRRFLAGEPIRARRVTLGERLVKWARRKPAVAGLVAAVILVASLGLAGVIWQWQRALAREAEAKMARLEAVQQRDQVRQVNQTLELTMDHLRRTAYLAQINLAQRYWNETNLPRVQELLEQEVPRSAGEPDLREFEWYYLDQLLHADLLTYRGHDGYIWSLAFAPDGRRVATAGEDRTVQVWDAGTGQRLREFREHTQAPRCVRFSPDGQRIASSGLDATIRIWDPTTGRVDRVLSGHTAHEDGPAGREPLAVWCVSFHPEGRRLASGSSDRTVKLWDLPSGKELRTVREHASRVLSVAYSPDGSRIASADSAGTILLWDPSTGGVLRRFQGSTNGVLALAFHPDGRRLAAPTSGSTITVWDPESGRELRRFAGHDRDPLSLAFSPDGRALASGGGDKTVRLWDVASGRLLHTIKGHSQEVRGLAFAADGRRLASAGADGTAKLWDPLVGQDPRPVETRGGAILGAAFHPRGELLALALADHTVRLAVPATGKEIQCLGGHGAEVYGVAFSPDGKVLASCGRDGSVCVWDLATRKAIHTMIGNPGVPDHGNALFCIQFDPQGRWIAAAGADKIVWVWDATSGKLVHSFSGHQDYIWGLDFHPEGTALASASTDRTVKLWDLRERKPLGDLRGHRGAVWSVAFHPDGRSVASGGQDQTVRFWDLARMTQTHALKGHNDHVYSVAFDASGRRLASASADRTVRIWDTASGHETLVLDGRGDQVRKALFHPGGRLLVSVGLDQVARLWDAGPLARGSISH